MPAGTGASEHRRRDDHPNCRDDGIGAARVGVECRGAVLVAGVDALCAAGLPVTAVARPCRPVGVGSEYIAAVVDSDNPSVVYANGSPIPLGTELTVSIATGRLCG